ncbi:hypothetical protein Y032_0045g1168 [Ancylostoma ceylanicum]|uniref:RING-type domain-containing protein n=1 Tax=Ancylostoma ceylanicum TaxID=53326 RepID=A0A016UDE1_9BILA|nr:hypothetical protein Y032_0045g1168 [Ancylostoma ceylanicum]
MRVSNQLCDNFIKKMFSVDPPSTPLIPDLPSTRSSDASASHEIGEDCDTSSATGDTAMDSEQPFTAMLNTATAKYFERGNEVDDVCSAGASNELAVKTGEFGCCTICLEEEPVNPVGCIYCKQLVGCRSCTSRWFYSSERSRLRSRMTWVFQDIFRALGPSNNERCPLCRHVWEEYPEVMNMCYLKND